MECPMRIKERLGTQLKVAMEDGVPGVVAAVEYGCSEWDKSLGSDKAGDTRL
jgi:hypothetical protein